MTNLPQTMAGDGKVSKSIRALTSQTNVIFPSQTPGMLTSRTTRGTFQRPSRRVRAVAANQTSAGARWL